MPQHEDVNFAAAMETVGQCVTSFLHCICVTSYPGTSKTSW